RQGMTLGHWRCLQEDGARAELYTAGAQKGSAWGQQKRIHDRERWSVRLAAGPRLVLEAVFLQLLVQRHPADAQRPGRPGPVVAVVRQGPLDQAPLHGLAAVPQGLPRGLVAPALRAGRGGLPGADRLGQVFQEEFLPGAEQDGLLHDVFELAEVARP